MHRLRILEIASELPPVQSGVARAAGRIADGLAARGHDLTLLSAADDRRWHLGEFRFSLLARRWVRLDELIADVDLVHLTGPAPFIADAFLARWMAARGLSRRRPEAALPPLVYTHGFTMVIDGVEKPAAAYRRVVDPLFRAADAIVVTTPSYRDLVGERYHGSIHVIPWANDLPPAEPHELLPFPGDRPLRLLFVGQQRPYKGIGHLIDAVAGIDGATLTIAGGGPGGAGYEQQAARRMRETGVRNIRHLGRVPDDALRDLYLHHDVICLPSTNASEAFGIVLVEGMALGCMALASRLPGVTDVVGDGGVLVDPASTDDLRRTIAGLVADPAQVRALQRAAGTEAAAYNWETSVDRYEELYLALVRQAGTP